MDVGEGPSGKQSELNFPLWAAGGRPRGSLFREWKKMVSRDRFVGKRGVRVELWWLGQGGEVVPGLSRFRSPPLPN